MRVSKNEFLSCGMIQFIIQFQKKWNKESKRRFISSTAKSKKKLASGRPPSLSDPQQWFEFVDKSREQELSADEVIHGLILSLKPSTSQEMVTIRDIVEHSFLVFDSDGNGSIDKWEFLINDGMSEALIRIEDQWKVLDVEDRAIDNLSKFICPPLR